MSFNPVFQYTRERFPEGCEDAIACGLTAEPNNKWYFWTEIQTEAIGPYETEDEAWKDCERYCANL
jgi:hypothetical protein